MITVRGLTKRYGYRLALRNVDLQVKPGQLVALLGPNGAGKSTLLRLLATLAKPTAGYIELAGNRLPEQAIEARSSIGFVGHEPLLYQDLSAEQNLAFFARLFAVSNASRRIAQLLTLLDLISRARDPVRTFSRGMQQRLALGRALLHRPKILLLDEPHSALDLASAQVLDGVLRDQIKRGAAVLFATHDLSRVTGLATRVEVMVAGQIVTTLRKPQLNSSKLSALYTRALRRQYAG